MNNVLDLREPRTEAKYQTLSPGTVNFKLGVFCTDYTQPLALMRLFGPLAMMAKEDRRLELVFPPRDEFGNWQLNWNWLIQCDAIFMSHPVDQVTMDCLWLANVLGVPSWIDYGDDVLNVPRSNPSFYTVYRDKVTARTNIGNAVKVAHAVSVCSEPCKESFINNLGRDAAAADKIHVLSDIAWFPPLDGGRPRKRRVTWRGLASHDDDVSGVLNQLCEVARDFRSDEWEWVFFGEPNEEFFRELAGAVGKEHVLIVPYLRTPFHFIMEWNKLAPYLHLVPLEDSAFNRSKTANAYYEAAAVGAGIVVPSYLPEWDKPGVVKYSGELIQSNCNPTFGDVLRRELAGFSDGKLHPGVAAAREYIYPDREAQPMNQHRWQILRGLGG